MGIVEVKSAAGKATGLAISPHQILTVEHAVRDTSTAVISGHHFEGEHFLTSAKVICRDEANDLAVLETTDVMDHYFDVHPSEPLMTAGATAFGLKTGATDGRVRASDTTSGRWFMYTGGSLPGDSGGPLFAKGRLFGLIAGELPREYRRRGWKTTGPSISVIRKLLDRCRRGRRPSARLPADPPAPPLPGERGPKGDEGPRGAPGRDGKDGASVDMAVLIAASLAMRKEVASLRAELEALKSTELCIGFVATDGTRTVVERKTLGELSARPGGGFYFGLSKLLATDAGGGH